MKKIVSIFLFALVCTIAVVAQTPTLSYQAVVRNSNNQLVLEEAVTATVNLYNGADLTAAYAETHNVTTDRNGLLNLSIGSGGVSNTGDLAAVDWSIAQIEIQLSWNSGTSSATLPRTTFSVVPSALYSHNTNYANLPKVTSIANPSGTDLVTEGAVKTYVDGEISTVTSTYATKNGDNTFTGNNDFTLGTIIVPTNLSNPIAFPTPCTNAANLCDLTMVFDSLARQIDTLNAQVGRELTILEDSLTSLKDSLAQIVEDLKPKLSLTALPAAATISLCGGSSTAVTYTATGGSAPYTWKVNGTDSTTTTNTLVVNFTAVASNTVTVTAAGFGTTKATTTITNTGTSKPTIEICEDKHAGTITLKTVARTTQIDFYNAATELQRTVSTGLAARALIVNSGDLPVGVYTVIASNSYNCVSDNFTAVIERVFTHCAGTPRPNEAGTGQIDSVRDHEDNWYEVVQIGSQCWMRENMQATTFVRDYNTTYTGNTIPELTETEASVYTPYIYKPNSKYGVLYNWAAAIDTNLAMDVDLTDYMDANRHRGICPAGWHLPTDAEWNILEEVVGVPNAELNNTGYRGEVAYKLTGGCDWFDSETANTPGNYSTAARNSTYFSALPAGFYSSSYLHPSGHSYFWSATQSAIDRAYNHYHYYASAGIARGGLIKNNAYSVRCVRD